MISGKIKIISDKNINTYTIYSLMSGLVNQEDKVRDFDAYNIRCKWNMVELENSKIVKS